MKIQTLFMFFLMLLLLGCDKDEVTKSLNFEQFKVEVPSNWEKFSLQGIDSQVGGITNGEDELVYDYGLYSYGLDNEKEGTHLRTTTTIDGKPALIVRPRNEGTGLMGVSIQVDSQTRFVLYGRNIKDEGTAINIFESVRF